MATKLHASTLSTAYKIRTMATGYSSGVSAKLDALVSTSMPKNGKATPQSNRKRHADANSVALRANKEKFEVASLVNAGTGPSVSTYEAAVDQIAEEVSRRYVDMTAGRSNELRNHLHSITNRELGKTMSHAYGDVKKMVVDVFKEAPAGETSASSNRNRGAIIAGMFDTDDADSALNRMIRNDTEKALDHWLAMSASDRSSPDSVQQAIDATSAIPPGEAKHGSLEDKISVHRFSARLLDEFMTPKSSTVEDHARKLQESTARSRAELDRLSDQALAGTVSKKEFLRGFDATVKKETRSMIDECGGPMFGLDKDQHRLLDHMHANYSHKVFQASGNVSTAMSALGFVNAFLPGANLGVARAGVLVMRGIVGQVGQAGAQYFSSQVVGDAKGHRVYTKSNQPAPTYSVFEKQLIRLSSDEISSIMTKLTEESMGDAIQPVVGRATRQLQWIHQKFPTPASAEAFTEAALGHHELLCELSGESSVKNSDSGGLSRAFGFSTLDRAQIFAQLSSFMVGAQEKSEEGSPHDLLARRTEQLISLMPEGPKKNEYRARLATLDAQWPARLSSAIDVATRLDDRGGDKGGVFGAQDFRDSNNIAAQAARESPSFAKTLELLKEGYLGHLGNDAAMRATAKSVAISMMLNAASSALVSLAASAATTAAGIATTPVGGAAVGAAVGIAGTAIMSKTSRMVTAATHVKGSANTQALADTVAHLNPSSPMPSVAQISDKLKSDLPKLEEAHDKSVEDVIQRHLHDAMSGIAQSRATRGRLLLGSVFDTRTGADTAKMKLLLDFEKTGNDLRYSSQKNVDNAKDKALIGKYRQRVEVAGGSLEDEGRAALENFDSNRKVVEVKTRIDKHLGKADTLEPQVAELAASLLGEEVLDSSLLTLRDRMTARNRSLTIDAEDWAAIRAGILDISDTPKIREHLKQAESRLRAQKFFDASDASDAPNAVTFTQAALALKKGSPDKKQFTDAIHKANRDIEKFGKDIDRLITDYRALKTGATGDIKDDFGIYKEMFGDYRVAQLQIKNAILSNGEYSAARMGGRLIGGSVLGGSLGLALSTGGLGIANAVEELGRLDFKQMNPGVAAPEGALSALNPISLKGANTSINLMGAAQAASNSLTLGTLSPFASGGDYLTHTAAQSPSITQTMVELGMPAHRSIEDFAMLPSFASITTKRDAAHRKGTRKHERVGLLRQGIINIEDRHLAAQARRGEGHGAVYRSLQAFAEAWKVKKVFRMGAEQFRPAAPVELAATYDVLQGTRSRTEAIHTQIDENVKTTSL